MYLIFRAMEQLLNHLKNYHPLSKEAGNALINCLEEKVFAKNDFLIKQGRVCTHFYFLQHGALRGFYHVNDKEITNWFAFENTFVSSFYSFTTQQPAVESIQFIEGSVLWGISRKRLIGLFDEFHEIERLVRIIYEAYYIRLEERYVNAQFKTAQELYNNLLKESPHILERVPLGYISSYLGITQETLSRIRKMR